MDHTDDASNIQVSAFYVVDAHSRLESLNTSKDCSTFCIELMELIFKANKDNSKELGLEEPHAINNASLICVRCSRKAFLLLVSEFNEQIKAMGANSNGNFSVDSIPVKSSNEVVTPFSPVLPIEGKTANKRVSTSPKRKKGKKKIIMNANEH
ncbi:hypothetical protein TNCT_383691 [Trichonephila clavata]|uniref:Uncharacterized protein n=1 Tax=Trichonephila clavata TaxID=2740835 RepID=A0A8X6H0X3_TRICU|nr:hypothetical protein TNCT_383691 [Trichonephila clavata]